MALLNEGAASHRAESGGNALLAEAAAVTQREGEMRTLRLPTADDQRWGAVLAARMAA
jgi:hypothetical protein